MNKAQLDALIKCATKLKELFKREVSFEEVEKGYDGTRYVAWYIIKGAKIDANKNTYIPKGGAMISVIDPKGGIFWASNIQP